MDALTLLSWLFVLFQLPTGTRAQEDITAQRFYQLATTGKVDLIVDVRTQEEWDTGHIPNATLAADFGALLSNTPAGEINATLKTLGLFTCLHCTTIVYCRSGARAGSAISLLRDKAGFIGATIYNGQGTSQWTDAGYSLVSTPSYEPPCMKRTPNGDEASYCPQSNNGPTATSPPATPATPPTSAPATTTLPQQKIAPPSKCGSIANDRNRGGAAAAAKECSGNGSVGRGRRRRLKGL